MIYLASRLRKITDWHKRVSDMKDKKEKKVLGLIHQISKCGEVVCSSWVGCKPVNVLYESKIPKGVMYKWKKDRNQREEEDGMSFQKLFSQLRIEIWSGSDLLRRKMKKPRVIANASNFLFLYPLSPAFPLITESDVSHLKGDQNILLLQIWKPLLERITKHNFRC